jgi:spindle assembly abnormal protein 6
VHVHVYAQPLSSSLHTELVLSGKHLDGAFVPFGSDHHLPRNMDVSAGAMDDVDAFTAETVFWEALPVLLQQTDREDTCKVLNVRLLLGTSRQRHPARFLRMHIFSEDDLLLLHTLDVGEDDFQQLKVEQGILVEFSKFADKLVGLLQKCVDSSQHSVPCFRAFLCALNGQYVFKLVETNDFKQLAHISLCFRPGTDAAVKSFLAFRVSELRRDRDDTREQLRAAKLKLEEAERAAAELQNELEVCRHSQQELRRHADARLREATSSARCARISEREEYLRGLERYVTLANLITSAHIRSNSSHSQLL